MACGASPKQVHIQHPMPNRGAEAFTGHYLGSADKLVTHITIEQFLPQKKPRHYEHVVLNVVDS